MLSEQRHLQTYAFTYPAASEFSQLYKYCSALGIPARFFSLAFGPLIAVIQALGYAAAQTSAHTRSLCCFLGPVNIDYLYRLLR